jgi:hypothetical protein
MRSMQFPKSCVVSYKQKRPVLSWTGLASDSAWSVLHQQCYITGTMRGTAATRRAVAMMRMMMPLIDTH